MQASVPAWCFHVMPSLSSHLFSPIQAGNCCCYFCVAPGNNKSFLFQNFGLLMPVHSSFLGSRSYFLVFFKSCLHPFTYFLHSTFILCYPKIYIHLPISESANLAKCSACCCFGQALLDFRIPAIPGIPGEASALYWSTIELKAYFVCCEWICSRTKPLAI